MEAETVTAICNIFLVLIGFLGLYAIKRE